MRVCLVLACAIVAVFAAGPEVPIENPDECDNGSGYLAGVDFDNGDVCSFVVCNAANNNKTGFMGRCMGGTCWNNEIFGCDDKKYVLDCDPTQCNQFKRTDVPCTGQPDAGSCCSGQDLDRDVFGHEPLLFSVDGSATQYRVDGDPWVMSCPEGYEFNVEGCNCEQLLTAVAPCDGDGDYFAVDGGTDVDTCCFYLQCYANRTGTYRNMCMPPSVWNDANKTCDIVQNVPDCMNVFCGDETTDPPCPPVPFGDCCVAGNSYTTVSDISYVIIDGPGALGSAREICCPKNMDDLQMIFNATTCCCEDPQ